jgi:molybdopterin/thiamine biosynthesis adenylyltransferase
MELTPAERERYDRQIGPGVLSENAQLRLKQSTAFVTRVGGMGGPAALMLAMAGTGRVIIAHGGPLISPDLNRQVLGSERGLGQPRAPAFADYLRSMNRFVEVEALDHEPNDDEAMAIVRRSHVVVSCPPTFEERLRLNRAAVATGVPLVDAAQWGMTGTLVVVRPGHTACLACVYPDVPPFEEKFPVIGAISSALGSLAALESIKILAQTGKPMWGKMLTWDGYQGRVTSIELARRDDCPVCGAQT